jgi:hypothetical protein
MLLFCCQVYIAELMETVGACVEKNIHNRTRPEIEKVSSKKSGAWFVVICATWILTMTTNLLHDCAGDMTYDIIIIVCCVSSIDDCHIFLFVPARTAVGGHAHSFPSSRHISSSL